MNSLPVLEIQNLSINFKTPHGMLKAVDDVSFSVNSNEIFGIVGESGSGKTQTVLAIMRLLASNAACTGSIQFMQQELTEMALPQLNTLRGNKLAIIFQNPMTSLNPFLTIKSQMIEVLRLHKNMSRADAIADALKMLDFVRIADAKNKINCYPHELSGGMRQRVMIGIALLCNPQLLIADEPTTALDVTVQAQILDILQELQREFHTAIVLITHDMGVVAQVCERVGVMYAGRLMETGRVDEIFYNPVHPYTQALLGSIPSLDHDVARLNTIPGELPNLMHMPRGCAFQERCLHVHAECRKGEIAVQDWGDRRINKCNLPRAIK